MIIFRIVDIVDPIDNIEDNEDQRKVGPTFSIDHLGIFSILFNAIYSKAVIF